MKNNNKITFFSVLPQQHDPDIVGLGSNYAVGENVTANCSSWPSVPKAKLHWTVNGEPVIAYFLALFNNTYLAISP